MTGRVTYPQPAVAGGLTTAQCPRSERPEFWFGSNVRTWPRPTRTPGVRSACVADNLDLTAAVPKTLTWSHSEADNLTVTDVAGDVAVVRWR